MADKELTDEELAAAFGTEIPSGEIKAAGVRQKRGRAETALLHGSQGIVAGFLDDLTGAAAAALTTKPGRWLREKTGVMAPVGDIDPLAPETGKAGEAFTGARESQRQDLKETKQDNPGVAAGAEILGAVASPVGKIAPGAGVTAKLLPQATSAASRLGARAAGAGITAATQGAVSGVGYSEADNVVDVAKDAAVSAGLGGAIGAAGGALAGGVRELADNAYIREVVGAAPKAVETAPATAATRTAVTMATDGPSMPSMSPRTAVDPVLPASVAPDSPTVFERAPAKTEIGAQAQPDNWHDFLKGRIGPAMAANNNNAAKAIAELSQDWKALQRNARRAPTIAEPGTVLEGPPANMPDPTEARTVFNPSANTVPDIDAAKARANARKPSDVDPMAKTDLDKTYVDMTPPPRVPKGAEPIKKGEKAPPTRDEILDAGYRKKATKDREELKRLIVAEIAEGDGIRPTATAVKKLDKADDAIASEVIDGPDKKAVRDAYLGRAKPGREKLAKVINDVDSQNEKLYAEFTKAGRNTVDHEAYRKALQGAAKKANLAGSPMDTALLDQLTTRFDDMVTRNEGAPVTLAQLRGWTTEVQGLAASAIGGLNEHTTAALKARAARLVTEHMYGVMEKAAKGDPALQKAARQIAVNNKRLHGLLTIDEALARRQPKEQVSKTVGQRVVEAGVTGAAGAAAGAAMGGENADGTALGLGLAGAVLGSRGQAANAIGRRVQRGATTKAIKSAENAARGRIATEVAEDAAINPVVGGVLATGRNLDSASGRGAPEDLSVLTADELAREIAISSKDSLNGERYRRAIRELQSR